MPKITIESDGTVTKLFINGQQIEDVMKLEFYHVAGDVATCEYTTNAFYPKRTVNNWQVKI